MTNKLKAEDMARAVNGAGREDQRASDRFGGFAQLAVYDGDKAAKELERCVKKLGFKGVLFNGYGQVGGDDNLVYLDEDRCAPIWAAMRGDGPTAPSMFPRRREDETSDD